MKTKRNLSYSQILVLIILGLVVIWVTWSYILASCNLPANETLAGVIVTTLPLALIGYFTKTYKEKDSRNKYHIDENGIPYNLTREGEELEENQLGSEIDQP